MLTTESVEQAAKDCAKSRLGERGVNGLAVYPDGAGWRIGADDPRLWFRVASDGTVEAREPEGSVLAILLDDEAGQRQANAEALQVKLMQLKTG
jgi:hypothetical protein